MKMVKISFKPNFFLLELILIQLLFLLINTSYSQSWLPLDSGVHGGIRALTVYHGELIAAGHFITAGGVPVNNIAKWNGSSWSPLGTGITSTGNPEAFVYALTVYNGELIAAGEFTTAGNVSALRIAKWDGNSWSRLSSGIYEQVYALTVYNGELIAGGKFNDAGEIAANDIARWNGSTWAALGTGMGGYSFPYVFTLEVFGNELIAGGDFTSADGVNANHIAKWNGSSWAPLDSGLSYGTIALTVFSADLIATDGYDIERWNGSSWTVLPARDGNTRTRTLNAYENSLIAGGDLPPIGINDTNSISKWNGNSWVPLGSGLSSTGSTHGFLFAMTNYGTDLIAAGEFNSAGGLTVNSIARWSDLTGINITGQNIPGKFNLSQNYPNPFNPSTKITFDISKTSQAKLSVYNILGEEISTLVNEQLKPGTYEINWNASNYPSGIYLYRLTAGDFTESKKMMLIK